MHCSWHCSHDNRGLELNFKNTIIPSCIWLLHWYFDENFPISLIYETFVLPLVTQLWPDFTIPSLESISIGKSVFHEHFLFFEFGLNVNPLHSRLQLQNFLQLIRFSSLNCSSNPSFHSLLVSPWHIEPMVSLKPLQWRLILLVFFDHHI